METVSIADILKLEISERIQLVEDIWDSISTVPEAVILSDAQREEIDRRLENDQKNPESGSPWDEVKNRILNQSGYRLFSCEA